ncbi:MAG: septum site-determining protein MinC [Clostridiales bacterium]|jgi:septum site-determining protein MinC|nr:septum site-determining protein MinC [Eubacteriales bacterium]MDH7566400.1 septum site-determining protein MinC [Clostridiales bacterium]
MDEANVTFKGSLHGLTIILKEEDGFESILEQIERKVVSAGKFFKGASLHVKYRGKKLSKDQEDRVFNLLASKSGARIKSLTEDTEEPPEAQNNISGQTSPRIRMKDYYFNGINEGVTKFYRGTVRSGQLVDFKGNLVVIGDVNPGGELIASGNVIVVGSLRGIVHAGADGNKDAIVVALNLQPTQLRIADVITRSPDDEKDSRNFLVPELAYVKDNMVYIERFLPQR